MTDSQKCESRTYSVSLLLDQPSAEKILSAQKELSQVIKNDQLTKNPPPPHITLGFFHATDEDFPKLKAAFEDFARSAGHSFEINFGQPDSFLDKVIFLPIKEDSKSFAHLKALNAILHEKLADFETGGNRNYTPERFFPHTALAVKLTKDQFEKGMNWAQGNIPLATKIIAVSLATTHPYKELSRITLSTDTLSLEQRHKNMSAIRSTGGKLEVALRSQLFKFGFRFRKNDKRLTGSPDIVFPHYKAVIFINGCFWHAHGWLLATSTKVKKSQKTDMIKSSLLEENVLYSLKCEKFRMPRTNPDFWLQKFTRNRERDIRDIEKLLEEGWRVGVVWECSITGRGRKQKIISTAEKISLWLEEGQSEIFREF
ncbi:2'-5' RNA ligase family protein [uncultured Treponema sp.]|uniref:2'-5' RNA ligase family protein n=1 Tax=uncultured Treponema sp. TaxID=162155 RepID=UPI0025E7015D|nr:2'-5' RNA ligase family protein [uncultured Treponema sp.]